MEKERMGPQMEFGFSRFPDGTVGIMGSRRRARRRPFQTVTAEMGHISHVERFDISGPIFARQAGLGVAEI